MGARKKRAVPPPEVFFETLVPRVLRIMQKTCTELGGRYAVVVEGAGAWTLDFRTQSVVAAAAADADVTVQLTAPQFASLATGKVELLKLVADGAAPCRGERAKVENVSLVLAFLE